jgi:site-specific recombinase XerD
MTAEPLATVGRLHPVTEAEASDAATLVAAWLAILRFEEGLSERSVVTYQHHVGRFTAWLDRLGLDVISVQRTHVRSYLRNEAARGPAPSTRATALFAIRSYFRYLVQEELLPVNPTTDLTVPGAAAQRTSIPTRRRMPSKRGQPSSLGGDGQ